MSSPPVKPPRPSAATTLCQGKINGIGFFLITCPIALAPLGFPTIDVKGCTAKIKVHGTSEWLIQKGGLHRLHK